jgi:hypothetical protein
MPAGDAVEAEDSGGDGDGMKAIAHHRSRTGIRRFCFQGSVMLSFLTARSIAVVGVGRVNMAHRRGRGRVRDYDTPAGLGVFLCHVQIWKSYAGEVQSGPVRSCGTNSETFVLINLVHVFFS